jgi:DNA (cytosine-5)-methyltransferase 1
MLENVRGLGMPVFDAYRHSISRCIEELGYRVRWVPVNAIDFGVPQSRPRLLLIALSAQVRGDFCLPMPRLGPPVSVGEILHEAMAEAGWEGAADWARQAGAAAPALVGGSRKHGGPDLGPTRARAAWAQLGVDGRSLADRPPSPGQTSMPKLTTRMAALIQGFPKDWAFAGTKTQVYRQIGNAFPPPVAAAVGRELARLLGAGRGSV